MGILKVYVVNTRFVHALEWRLDGDCCQCFLIDKVGFRVENGQIKSFGICGFGLSGFAGSRVGLNECVPNT